MTLASNSRKPNPSRSSVTGTSRATHSHAETLPPTLLRLPRIGLMAAEPVKPAVAPPPSEPMDGVDQANVGATVVEHSVVPQQAAAREKPSPDDVAIAPPRPRHRFVEQAKLRVLHLPAMVDRLATRKTLSAALIVVAALAIWAPRSKQPDPNSTPLEIADSDHAHADGDLELDESDHWRHGITAPNPSDAPRRELSSIEPPSQPTHFKPELAGGMDRDQSQSIGRVSRESSDSESERAVWESDPLASAANDQIRRMDATYADLPHIAAMDAASIDSEVPNSTNQHGDEVSISSLPRSRTPHPITNWEQYLPPIDAETFDMQVAGDGPSLGASAASGSSVDHAGRAGSVQTTASPVAPDFRFAFPDSEALIEADEHIAMPPVDGEGQTRMR